jgi:type IX secretion system PorP/SprF family membrane protein
MEMMKRKLTHYIYIVVLLFLPLGGWAQQAPAFSHYWDLETQFNPAAVGRTPQLAINAAYRTNASGFEDSGGTMFAGADMAFVIGRTRHGVGVLFQKDAIGLFAHQRFSVQYAYHLKVLGGTLSIGAEVDMMNEKVDGSKADLGDANDPAFPSSELSGSKFDVSAGLYYLHGPWYAGFSMLNITAPTVLLGETNEIALKNLYNFTAGYNIRTRNPLLTIVPSAMLRYDGADWKADITARLLYAKEKKRLYGGMSYSPQHSVTLFVGGRFKGVDLSYSYEANTEGMGMESGHHEVTLGYRLDLDLSKKGKNLHKSVRWL